MPVWDKFLTERDKQVFLKSGHSQRQGFGKRPAVLIIDVNYGWVGLKPEPVLTSIDTVPSSCGQEGWDAVYETQKLLRAARSKGVPVFYTTANDTRMSLRPDARGKHRAKNYTPEFAHRLQQIVEEIAPIEGEVVIYKHAPSAFFATPLIAYLVDLQVDSILACGGSTSGCVRASVVDASSHHFKVSLIEECTFDRGQASHAMSLFDMNAKYADVVPLAAVQQYLASLPDGLFPSIHRVREPERAGARA